MTTARRRRVGTRGYGSDAMLLQKKRYLQLLLPNDKWLSLKVLYGTTFCLGRNRMVLTSVPIVVDVSKRNSQMEIFWNSMMKGKLNYHNHGLLKVNIAYLVLGALLILLYAMGKKALVAYSESKTPWLRIFWGKVEIVHAQTHPWRPGRLQKNWKTWREKEREGRRILEMMLTVKTQETSKKATSHKSQDIPEAVSPEGLLGNPSPI